MAGIFIVEFCIEVYKFEDVRFIAETDVASFDNM